MAELFNPKTWTLGTTHDGDLARDAMNRPVIVRGTKAVHQDLSVAVKTDEGEDPIDPEFGSNMFQMQKSLTEAEREFRDTLLHDPRVASVPNIDILVHPGRRENAQVKATVVLRSYLDPDAVENEIIFDLGTGTITFGPGLGF